MVNKKAQAWGFDLMIASVIFTGAIVTFFIFSLNTPSESNEIILSLERQGDLVANSLLSEGYPPNWNSQDVAVIGLLTDNKINESKLSSFYDLSISNYQKTKSLFGISSNYLINLSEPIEINYNVIAGIGETPENPENLLKISRITIYKNKPVTLEIQIWE